MPSGLLLLLLCSLPRQLFCLMLEPALIPLELGLLPLEARELIRRRGIALLRLHHLLLVLQEALLELVLDRLGGRLMSWLRFRLALVRR